MSQTVYFNPITPLKENRAPGAVVVGSPGSGKSYFGLQIMRNTLMQNCRIIGIDPKDDMKDICKLVPNVKNINLIEKFCLDPFRVLDSVDTNFIVGFVSTMIGGLTKNEKTAITPIVTDFVTKSKTRGDTNFNQFVNYLYSNPNPECINVGNALKANEDNEFSEIIFSPTNNKTLTIGEGNVVFTLNGLPLPKEEDRTKWTEIECFGSAILTVIIKMLNQVLTKNKEKGVPCVLIVDEAHIAMANPEIYKIISNFLILGRSLGIATVLFSQNISHFPEDFNNYISNKFLFKSSEDAANDFLKRFLKEYKADYLIPTIKRLEPGNCLMVDRLNRFGFVSIDSDLGITSAMI